MRRVNSLAFIVLIGLFLVACRHALGVELQFTDSAGRKSPTIKAEVVSTPDKRNLGMMYRRDLAPEEGMLFVFPEMRQRTFWMKNTYVELDMIFMDESLKVVSILERATPLTTTPRRSEKHAQYVLEINGGKAKEWGIAPGWQGVVRGELPVATQ